MDNTVAMRTPLPRGRNNWLRPLCYVPRRARIEVSGCATDFAALITGRKRLSRTTFAGLTYLQRSALLRPSTRRREARFAAVTRVDVTADWRARASPRPRWSPAVALCVSNHEGARASTVKKGLKHALGPNASRGERRYRIHEARCGREHSRRMRSWLFKIVRRQDGVLLLSSPITGASRSRCTRSPVAAFLSLRRLQPPSTRHSIWCSCESLERRCNRSSQWAPLLTADLRSLRATMK